MNAKPRHKPLQPATVQTQPLVAEWLKPGLAGKPFGLGRTTIYELITEGKIKSAKVGKARLVSVASLRAYIEGLADNPPAARRVSIRPHVG